jgi:hypothetical protein
VLHADDQVRIGNQRQILQRLLQVPRTYLAGSAGPVDRFRQTHLRFLVHAESPPLSLLRLYTRADRGFPEGNLTDIVTECEHFQSDFAKSIKM